MSTNLYTMNIILNFHDVSSVDWFKNIIQVFGKVFRFVAIDNIESFLEGKIVLRNSCHITFDDGDMSFYKNAYPVLKRNNIPASLYISPDIILEKKNYWFQDLKEIMTRLDTVRIKESICEVVGCDYNSIHQFEIFTLFKLLQISEILKIIEYIKEKHKIQIDTKYNITKKQMLELVDDDLVTIGAHTATHPILQNEDNQTAVLEITKSIDDLSGLLGGKIKYFAYPNGIPGMDYGDRERKILKDKGIRLAFNTNENFLNVNDGRYDISRCGLSKGNTVFICTKLFTLPIWKMLKRLLKKQQIEEVQRLKATKALREI